MLCQVRARDIDEHMVRADVEVGAFAGGNPACAIKDAGLPVRTMLPEPPALTGAEVALLLLCGVSMIFLKPLLSRARESMLTMSILIGMARFAVAVAPFCVSGSVGGGLGPETQLPGRLFSQGIVRAGALRFGAY